MKKILFTIAASFAMLTIGHAQDLPNTIKIVVPFAAGASTDVTARRLANLLAQRLEKTVIVENRPGASGMIGGNAVVRGPKDGSQLLFTSVSLVSSAALMKNPLFNIITDLTPIAVTGEGPLLISVPGQSSIQTPQDLIDAARAKPDQLSHGTAGVATIAHVVAEMLNNRASIQIRHIPYKGAAPAVTDTVSGILDVHFSGQSTVAAQLNGGNMRIVAVTSEEPSDAFPGVPTMSSVVPGFSASFYNVLLAPTGTPADLIDELNTVVNELSNSDSMREIFQADGFVAVNQKPDEIAKRIAASYATFVQIGNEQNIMLE